jgi:type III restriction enzyme
MYLKPYQVRVTQAIDETLRRLRVEKDRAAPGVNWVQTALNALGLTHRDRCWNGLGQPYPRLVLKIPTGGGKTLLAVEAIRAYQNLFAQKRTGLVVWVVPTETIYTQTVRRLRDKGHHLRQLLDQSSGNRTIILEKGQKLTREDVRDNLVILFVMIQSISRAANKEALKVFQDSGGYEGFFPADHRYDLHAELLAQYPNLDYIAALGDRNPLIKTSLGNAVRVSRPFLVIDEIHKVFSETARAAIDSLNPEMVLGLSATPKREMTLLVSVSGLELKQAEMVKLDMHIYPPQQGDWRGMVTALRQHRDRLEQQARAYHLQGGVYIRPIALIQVEATGKDQRGRGRVHSLDVKDYLTQTGVSPAEVAIKTSAQNDIEDVNLLSPDCAVRYIITKEALREGWDVSFAYLLGIIPNVQSDTGLTQLIGRILRQPNARKTGLPELDESYVYYCNGSTRALLERVQAGLKHEGLEDLMTGVRLETDPPVRRAPDLTQRASPAPGLMMLPDGRPFSYKVHTEPALDFRAFTLDETHLSRLRAALRAGNRPAAEIIFTLDEQGRAVSRAGWTEPAAAAPEETNLQYLTHRYAEWVQNPFLARAMAQQHIARLEAELGREAVAAHFSRLTALLVDFLREYTSERAQAALSDR